MRQPGRGIRRLCAREEGSALVELVVAIPILIALLAVIFDAGLGFSSAREASNVARSAARVAALAGDDRLADYYAIDAVRSSYDGTGDDITWMTVYRTTSGSDGVVPAECGPTQAGLAGTCNVYDAATISAAVEADFSATSCVGDPDSSWCPLDRAGNDGDFLGVAIWVSHAPTVGIFGADDYELEDRSVFALWFE